MTDLVPRHDIERIVGCPRHPREHRARAVSAEQTVYILHSAECLDMQDAGVRDLRACPYSVALDQGIDLDEWYDSQDVAVVVTMDPEFGLVPLAVVERDQLRDPHPTSPLQWEQVLVPGRGVVCVHCGQRTPCAAKVAAHEADPLHARYCVPVGSCYVTCRPVTESVARNPGQGRR